MSLIIVSLHLKIKVHVSSKRWQYSIFNLRLINLCFIFQTTRVLIIPKWCPCPRWRGIQQRQQVVLTLDKRYCLTFRARSFRSTGTTWKGNAGLILLLIEILTIFSIRSSDRYKCFISLALCQKVRTNHITYACLPRTPIIQPDRLTNRMWASKQQTIISISQNLPHNIQILKNSPRSI